jgi:hypothetical protein
MLQPTMLLKYLNKKKQKMAYFNLGNWTKDTVNGLNQTIFGYLTESGVYNYTASGDNDRLFNNTGSAVISYEKIFSPITINVVEGSGSSTGERTEGGFDYHFFQSEYPFPILPPNSEDDGSTLTLTTGSLRTIYYASGSLPFE